MRKNWLLVLLLPLLTACSVVMATSGPECRDLSVLKRGTDRYQVLAELGQPVATEVEADGRKCDIFRFMQGQHGAVKAGKALLYGAADVLTFGVAELVTTPVEGVAGKGAEIKARVLYDAQNRVDEVQVLGDGRWIPVQTIGDGTGQG